MHNISGLIFIAFTWPFFIIGVVPFTIMNLVSNYEFTSGAVEAGWAVYYCYSALMGFAIAVPIVVIIGTLS